MAYTNPWSDTIPLGSELASTIDDIVRQLRLDIHERMDDIVVDWTTDPVVPLSGAGIGPISGRFYEYAGTNPAGTRVTNSEIILAFMLVRYQGVTDAVGIIKLDFTEFPWTVQELTNFSAAPLLTETLFIRGRRTSDSAPFLGNIALTDEVAQEVWIKCLFPSGATVANTAVEVNLLFPMSAAH